MLGLSPALERTSLLNPVPWGLDLGGVRGHPVQASHQVEGPSQPFQPGDPRAEDAVSWAGCEGGQREVLQVVTGRAWLRLWCQELKRQGHDVPGGRPEAAGWHSEVHFCSV